MAREGRNLPSPFTADGPFLVAILDALDGIHDLLAARFAANSDVKPVKEPAVPKAPATAVPVEEPAPAGRPGEDEEEPVRVTEPAPPVSPAAPPRAGRGSSVEAWKTFADGAGVGYEPDASRDDIIAACVAAHVIDGR